MDTVYVEDGAIYCTECAIKGEYDEENFCMNSEADTPQHCDDCGVFLENPLTDDGEHYVKQAIIDYLTNGQGDYECVGEWAEYYDISVRDLLRFSHS